MHKNHCEIIWPKWEQAGIWQSLIRKMDLKQLRSNCQHLSLGNFTWTKKQSEKHILQNSGQFIKNMFKCIFCGTPQTIVYACAWFLRYFDFCLSLFTLFWFLFEFSVIRLDMYISWHLMLPNHFCQHAVHCTSQRSLSYDKTLGIFTCVAIN